MCAILKPLKTHGLKIDDDICLWELNEAYACQVVNCRDRLAIDPQHEPGQKPRRALRR